MDEVLAVAPEGTSWWIKGDACDVVSGLGESVKGVWSGDVDVNDGKLQLLYEQYCNRRKSASLLGCPNPADREAVIKGLCEEKKNLETDLDFISESKQLINCVIIAKFIL